MAEDLEYVDIAALTKIKMWYYNRTLHSHVSKETQDEPERNENWTRH